SLPVTSGLTGALVNGFAGASLPLVDDPVPLRLHAIFENPNLDFNQLIFLEAYPPPPEVEPTFDSPLQSAGASALNILKNSVTAGVELGSLEEKVPQITVSSSSLQPDGSLRASTSVNVADLNLEMGPLAGIHMPALAPVAEDLSTFRIRLTPGVHV